MAHVPSSQDHRIEFVVVQVPSSPQKRPAAFDHQLVPFSPRPADVPTGIATTRARRSLAGQQTRLRRYAIEQVAVVAVAGRLSDVVGELDRAIQVALTERARGVVCDLSSLPEGAQPSAVEVLAMAGRHVRAWPGIPVAVACTDPQTCDALRAHPLGRRLIVTRSLLCAMTAVLATRTLTVERTRLSPHASAPRESADFVARNLLSWRLGSVIPVARLVISELVARSQVDAGTDIDLSMVWNLGALRLTVADNGPDPRRERYWQPDPNRHDPSFVGVLSRAVGVLPTADGGKVVWAVLGAPRDAHSKPVPTPERVVG